MTLGLVSIMRKLWVEVTGKRNQALSEVYLYKLSYEICLFLPAACSYGSEHWAHRFTNMANVVLFGWEEVSSLSASASLEGTFPGFFPVLSQVEDNQVIFRAWVSCS